MQLATSISRLRNSRFVRDSSIVFGATMLVNACVFVFHASASRLLGINAFGELYALMALLPIVGIPATALATVVTKFAAEFRVLHDEAHLHGLVRRLSLWVGLGALAAIATGTLLQNPIAAFLNARPSAVVCASVLIGVTIALPPLRAVLQGLQDFRRFSLSSALEGLLKTALGILFLTLGWGVAGALLGSAAGGAIALGYTWMVLELKYGGAAPADFRPDLRRLLQTTSGALVLIATLTALSYGDALIVKHAMSASDSGLYAAVSLGGKVLLYVTSFVPLVLLPKAASRVTAGASPVPVLTGAALMWAALAAVALAVFYYAPGPIVRALVGAQFLSAAPLLFYYALAMSLLGAMNVIASYKIALHRFDFMYPFTFLTVAELATIAFYHPNLQTVITVLVVGNACGVLAGLFRIAAWRPAQAGVG